PAARIADPFQDVQGRPDRRIADRVDLGMDARAGSAANELLELRRLGHPDTPPAVFRERPPRLFLVVFEQRRRPRREGAIGEQLQPAHAGLAAGIVPDELAAADATSAGGPERVVPDR